LLSIERVSKVYRQKNSGLFNFGSKDVVALVDASLSIPDGETLAILGPNGSGKSTLCKIAAGITKPTSGKALLDGEDITYNIRRVSRKIGIVLGSSLVYHRLRGYDYLRFFAKLYEVPNYEKRIAQVAKIVNLENRLDSYIESYSTGMKMRISLARALLHDPSFLILDEFTMGLDPASARDMRELIKDMHKTVLLTTNQMADAEVIARDVAFISKGRTSTFDSIENVLKGIQSRLKIVVMLDNGSTKEFLEEMGSFSCRLNPDVKVEILIEEEELSSTLAMLARSKVRHIETQKPTLEDAYLTHTGQRLVEVAATR
jgi:ABC-2 type transport system ATP-binding protein